jgi:hypothetical protein
LIIFGSLEFGSPLERRRIHSGRAHWDRIAIHRSSLGVATGTPQIADPLPEILGHKKSPWRPRGRFNGRRDRVAKSITKNIAALAATALQA